MSKIKDYILGLKPINIFQGWNFSGVSLSEPEAINASATETVAEIVAEIAEEEEPVAVPQITWKEKEWLQASILRPDNTLIINRLNNKRCSLMPVNVSAAGNFLFHVVRHKETMKQFFFAESVEKNRRLFGDGRLYFPLNNILEEKPEESAIVMHLKQLGFDVLMPPSLANWLPKEYRRRKRENTPFTLPVPEDTRTLSERVEVGSMLQCVRNKVTSTGHRFISGQQYVVIQAPTAAAEDDQDTDNTEETVTVDTSVVKMRVVGKRSGNLIWPTDLPMEGHFKLCLDGADKLVPENMFIGKYPQLHAQALKTIEKQNLPVYDHVKSDLAQGIYHRHLLFPDDPRTGKTSKMIQYAHALGIQRCLFVTVKNGVQVFVDEFNRLGITDYKVLRSYKDIESPARYHIATHGFLKQTIRKKENVAGTDSLSVLARSCPHCHYVLNRRRPAWTEDGVLKPAAWEEGGGYLCVNPDCTHRGYSNMLRKVYDYTPVKLPMRYKRMKKRYKLICLDEAHVIGDATSDQARAILGLNGAKRRVAATGTLMPKQPQDAFHVLSWTFGNETHEFEFRRGRGGVIDFNKAYTDTVTVYGEGGSSYKRAIPFLKNPVRFWNWKASKMLFRKKTDPVVEASMIAAGVTHPTYNIVPIEIVPDPKQGILLAASLREFQTRFKEYSEEQKQKAGLADKVAMLNSSQILVRMHRMKYAASLPGLLNQKIIETGGSSVYDGSYGGCKTEYIRSLVDQSTQNGGKVVIFSDSRPLRELLAQELKLYHPILFLSSWSDEKRGDMISAFQKNPKYQVFIAGTRTVTEAVDLSAADTVISPDMLWTTGKQMQAWHRVLTPRTQQREVNIYIPLVKYSIDQHIFSTFYSRLQASDQAIYGAAVHKANKSFDVQCFVNQIAADEQLILQWLIESGNEEMEYLPVFQTLTQLSNYEGMVAA